MNRHGARRMRFHSLLLLTQLAILFLIGCGGGGGGGGASQGGETTAKTLLETQVSSGQYYNALLLQGDPEAISKTVTYIKSKSNISNVVVGNDCTSILIQYDSGVEGIILTKSIDFATNSVLSKTMVSNVNLTPTRYLPGVISGKKAIILLPIDNEPNYKDLSTNMLISSLQQSGYSVDVYVGQDVTIDLMKTLSNYHFIYMTTHGGLGSFGRVTIGTGALADVSLIDKLWYELVNGSISGISIITDPVSKRDYFGLNNNFFKNYTYPSSLIYMNACESIKNESMADSFLNHGASVYVGWDAKSFLDLGNLHNPLFFTELSKQNVTLGQAFSNSFANYYPAIVYKDSNLNNSLHIKLLNSVDLGTDLNDTIVDYSLSVKYKGNADYVLNNTTGTSLPPTVQTQAVTSITTNGATLNGNVNSNGLPTNYWFEFGTSSTLATYSTTTSKSAGSGTTIQSFGEPISGLQAGTPYYFRIVASNSGGTANGTIGGFSTGSGASTKWTKTFGFGPNDDYGTSVQQTIDGGFIVACVTSSWGPGDDNACLIKTDSNGNALWAKTYGEWISVDTANAVQQTSDGGYIFAGTTWSNLIAGGHNVYLVKTDLNGNTVWIKTYDGPDGYNDDAYSVRQTSDGGFIIAGSTTIYTGAPDYINLDYLLMKTDANGNIIWSKNYGGSGDETAKSVQQTLDGGYIFSGGSLVKTDTNGNIVWSKYGFGEFVHQTPDGGYIVAGTIGDGNSGGYDSSDVSLIKTDGSGNILWSKRHKYNGGGGNFYVRGAQPTSDGGCIISGYLEAFTTDIFLMKTDSNGDVIWLKTYGAGGGNSVQQTLDGGYIIAGATAFDVYLIKTDANGNTQ